MYMTIILEVCDMMSVYAFGAIFRFKRSIIEIYFFFNHLQFLLRRLKVKSEKIATKFLFQFCRVYEDGRFSSISLKKKTKTNVKH